MNFVPTPWGPRPAPGGPSRSILERMAPVDPMQIKPGDVITPVIKELIGRRGNG